jgi:hypothetical protein
MRHFRAILNSAGHIPHDCLKRHFETEPVPVSVCMGDEEEVQPMEAELCVDLYLRYNKPRKEHTLYMDGYKIFSYIGKTPMPQREVANAIKTSLEGEFNANINRVKFDI